jgi:nucleotide-binding universal stress UspA family protein
MSSACELLHHKEMAMKLKKILVPLDGSSLAEAAIETAIDLAAGAPFTLVLIRAAEAHTLPGADPTDVQVHVVREAEEYLAAVRDSLAKRGITNVDTAVWYGPAAPAIVEGARLKKADLVVMSSHGRSGLGRLILGSVAESVLRGTTVPVCIVRAPEAPLETPLGVAKPRSGKAAINI